MIDATPRTPRALLLAATILLAGLPLASLATPLAAAEGCQELDEHDYLVQSSPLEEQFSASQMLYIMLEDDGILDRRRANGVDAYVIDLGCRTSEETFTYLLEGDAKGNAYDLAIKFYGPNFSPTSDVINPADEPGSEGWVPAGSTHAVVMLEQGPYYSGLTRSSDAGSPRPYAASFTFLMGPG